MYKLLIADDEPLERQALRYFVEESTLKIGEIFECVNGRDAVQTVFAESPDIAILDIKMPELSGYEAMAHIKAVHPACKVIFSTAYDYFDYALQAIRMGATDFMVKPVSCETLMQALKKTIGLIDDEKLPKYDKKQKKISRLLEKRLVEELIQGDYDEETLWYLDSIGVEDAIEGYCFFAHVESPMDEQLEKLEFILREELLHLGWKHTLSFSSQEINGIVYLDEKEAPEKFFDILQRRLKSIFRDIQRGFNLYAGTRFHDIDEIRISYCNARSQAGDILDDICRDEGQPRQMAGQREFSSEIERVYAYVHDHYNEKITLDQVAVNVGFSKYYISRLFKQFTGSTIIDYLIKVRLDKAKELLNNPAYSIKEIGYTVGYSDPNYFTWSFKKNIGIPPCKYREYHNLA